jgi:hypothetical protein
VRVRSIAGKIPLPSDAGEGVGVCSRGFIVVCCLLIGCRIDVLEVVGKRHLGGGKGGLPPKGRFLCNLPCICDIRLRCL